MAQLSASPCSTPLRIFIISFRCPFIKILAVSPLYNCSKVCYEFSAKATFFLSFLNVTMQIQIAYFTWNLLFNIKWSVLAERSLTYCFIYIKHFDQLKIPSSFEGSKWQTVLSKKFFLINMKRPCLVQLDLNKKTDLNTKTRMLIRFPVNNFITWSDTVINWFPDTF